MKKKITLIAAALTLCCAAQTQMVGLPQYGITLTGTPEVPIIHNHSGKIIFAYLVTFVGPNDEKIPADMAFISVKDKQDFVLVAAGPKGVDASKPPLIEGQFPAGPRIVSQWPVVRVVLDGIVFSDWENEKNPSAIFVGPDSEGLSARMALKMSTESGIASALLRAQDKVAYWRQLREDAEAFRAHRVISKNTTINYARGSVSNQLIKWLDAKGESSALMVASRYANLPALKKEK
jgi:hypothetical protein